MIDKCGGVVKEEIGDTELAVSVNMTQLKFIKALDCVEKISEYEDEFLTLLRKEKNAIIQNAQTMTLTADEPVAMSAVEATGVAEASVACESPSSSCCCPSNNTMETAREIQLEQFVSGQICCPGAEQWFKFTTAGSGIYTIYTTGSLDTEGTLYDCDGLKLEEADNYNGRINFRIVADLPTEELYYIKVTGAKQNTGSYTLRVTEDTLVDSVSINKTTITLEKDVTYELPITPNYTYKGYNGAQRIPGLSVSISPSNANEQKIWWWEEYGSVLDCSYGWDDDGDRYIHVTATGIGTAKLYAEDWNENGKRDECEVTCNTPGMDSTPEHSHIYHAVLSEDRDEYTFTCISSQCDDSFTVPKDQVVGSYVTSSTDPRLGNSQTPLAYGIDISSYQEKITQSQWNEIANTQIDGHTIAFVILRIGREVSNNPDGSINRKKDEQFENNYVKAKAAGLQVGCYYYTESCSPENALADAEQVIEWIGDKQFEYPVFFDIESDLIRDNVSNNTIRTEICTSFMNKMREAGFFTGLYTNAEWITDYLNSSTLLPEYDFWYARYDPDDPTPNSWGKENGENDWAGTGRKFGMWQYTDEKYIPPITVNEVDRNVAYKNYPLIIKALHLNNFN